VNNNESGFVSSIKRFLRPLPPVEPVKEILVVETPRQQRQVRPTGQVRPTAFYDCPHLSCGLFYKMNPTDGGRPILNLMIYVSKLGRKVPIVFQGLGDVGRTKLEMKYGKRFFFPVDLYSQQPRLDPKPSNSVDEVLFSEWEKLIWTENP